MAPLVIPLLAIFHQLCLNSAQILGTSPPSPVFAAVHTRLVLDCYTVNKSNSITWQWATSKDNNSYSTTNHDNMTSLLIDRVNYSDSGVYVCRAVNQTSGLVLAQTSITVSIGDPPPKPPSPTVKQSCGYPPTEFIMSYRYTTPTSTHHPLTVELVIGSLKTCLIGCNDFKVVEQSRRIIRRPGKWSFDVNIAKVIKEIVPDFPYCRGDDLFDCTILCICVRTTNAFGQSISNATITRVEERCGEVADFRAINVGRKSLTLGWGLPKCLRNSKQYYVKLNYWIWCEPFCGQRVQISRDIKVITGLNYTIKSLVPYTNYTLYASCSFAADPEDAGKQTSISVQTKEEIPRAPPVIEALRWLSEPVCSESNGTAIFSWKVNDKSLLGKVRYYIITYQVDNSSSKTTRKVPAGVHRLVLSGLKMHVSYRFSAIVCSGGGCSKARYYSLSSFPCTASDTSPERLNAYPYWIWIVAASFVALFLMIVRFAFKRRGSVNLQRPALPNDGIYPTAVVYPRYEDPNDSDYARADVLSSSPNGLAFLDGAPQELRISTTCLTRSSSVLTCSTDI